jgi:serine/threonine protein kinase
MKVLRKRGIASCPADKRDKIKAQIISEIKIQSFLDHPNLVRLYDCFADHAHLYLFVELGCEGHLYELLKRNRKVSEEAISIVVREVARGIAYMHSQNVLHRDIKLENIVFTHVPPPLRRAWPRSATSGGRSTNRRNSGPLSAEPPSTWRRKC